MFTKYANYVGFRLPVAVSSFLKDTVRFASGRDWFAPSGCAKVIEPKCDPNYPEVCAESAIKNVPMKKYSRPTRYHRSSRKETGMWKQPDCCASTCPDLPVRMDEICYKSSDKRRNYRQTWVSCPPLSTLEIEMRCTCDDYPIKPLPRRKKEELPRKKGLGKQICLLACKMSNKYRWLMPCQGLYPAHPKQRKLCCFRAYKHGCDPPRNPPKCQKLFSPSGCKKEPTPYPSFSECQKICKTEADTRQCFNADARAPTICSPYNKAHPYVPAYVRRYSHAIQETPTWYPSPGEDFQLLEILWYTACETQLVLNGQHGKLASNEGDTETDEYPKKLPLFDFWITIQHD
uniref:Uncharacterized protein n=1 Tax=Glossina palpalis gambiensis TaxID=67801 RepID=A0A1B0ATS3_9MUSC